MNHAELAPIPASESWMGSNQATTSALATWVFLLGFFVFAIRLPSGRSVSLQTGYPVLGLLVLLTVGVLVRPHGQEIRRGIAQIGAAFFLLSFVVILYSERRSAPPWGAESRYLLTAAYYVLELSVVVAFASLFYDLRTFERVFWKVGTWSLGIALVGYALTTITGVSIITHTFYGTPRLQGMLTEPSAWAPVTSALFLLAINRRSYYWASLAFLATLLTKSPVVILVAAIAIPLYFVLTSPWRSSKLPVLVLIAIVIPLGVSQIQNQERLLTSGSGPAQAFGRLLSGVTYVRTGGLSGENERARSTSIVLRELRDNHTTWTGYGLGSSDVYFVARFPPPASILPNSLIVWTWFGFGKAVALSLVGLLIVASFRLHRRPEAAALFLPFIVAACVNSAQGIATWKFAILGLLVYLFGMARQDAHA